jgi:diguanylate cyclase (GGDEF)-like protein
LDRFKDINDSLGHIVGDQLLVEVAETLCEGLRATDTVARFGGDELNILLEDIQGLENVTRVTDWIEKRFSQPFHVMDHEVFTTASIGIVMSGPYDNAEDMIRDADIAMYEAKERGRSRAEIFEPSMRDRIMKRLSLETDFRKALTANELKISYLPVVSLETGHLLGFEALIRWQHPERGTLYPRDFISLAENLGMIADVDFWVMGEASQQVQKWHNQYGLEPKPKISVNFSNISIINSDFVETISKLLDRTGLEAEHLKLEISEHTIMQHSDIAEDVFSILSDLGVQVQIDNFGISYSSLERFLSYPINALKIDQTFIQKIIQQNSHLEIVKAIITLARRLNVGVIAEGIENKEQLDALKSLGCNQGQGYYFSKPLGSDDVEALLEEIKTNGDEYTPWDVN